MRKYAAASFVVLGITLTTYAMDTTELTTNPWTVDGPMRLLTGGVLSVMVGLYLASYRRLRTYPGGASERPD
jgi:hypothetical protein